MLLSGNKENAFLFNLELELKVKRSFERNKKLP